MRLCHGSRQRIEEHVLLVSLRTDQYKSIKTGFLSSVFTGSVCVCVCVYVQYVWTHRFSVVLKSNRELTDEMLRGRLPSPSSVSSSDFFLLPTQTGKYINFS